jgi:hypothetical protein
MAFWSDAGLEPKRKHKFLVFVGSLPAILAKSVNKPNADITVGEHKFLGNTYKFPGGIKWNDVTVTFVDTENDQIVQTIHNNILVNSGNQDPVSKGLALNGGGTLNLFDKSGAVSALKAGGGVIIQQVDETGKTVEEWTLYNAWISKIDLGDVSYENDNQLSEYKLTITYDWAQLTPQSKGATLSDEETSNLVLGANASGTRVTNSNNTRRRRTPE